MGPRRARLEDMIRSLSDGLDTVVGDRLGSSGGKQQRLTIARLLIAQPRVSLDEATAALGDQQAGDRQALPLAAGEPVAPLPHHGVQPIGQGPDHVFEPVPARWAGARGGDGATGSPAAASGDA